MLFLTLPNGYWFKTHLSPDCSDNLSASPPPNANKATENPSTGTSCVGDDKSSPKLDPAPDYPTRYPNRTGSVKPLGDCEIMYEPVDSESDNELDKGNHAETVDADDEHVKKHSKHSAHSSHNKSSDSNVDDSHHNDPDFDFKLGRGRSSDHACHAAGSSVSSTGRTHKKKNSYAGSRDSIALPKSQVRAVCVLPITPETLAHTDVAFSSAGACLWPDGVSRRFRRIARDRRRNPSIHPFGFDGLPGVVREALRLEDLLKASSERSSKASAEKTTARTMAPLAPIQTQIKMSLTYCPGEHPDGDELARLAISQGADVQHLAPLTESERIAESDRLAQLALRRRSNAGRSDEYSEGDSEKGEFEENPDEEEEEEDDDDDEDDDDEDDDDDDDDDENEEEEEDNDNDNDNDDDEEQDDDEDEDEVGNGDYNHNYDGDDDEDDDDDDKVENLYRITKKTSKLVASSSSSSSSAQSPSQPRLQSRPVSENGLDGRPRDRERENSDTGDDDSYMSSDLDDLLGLRSESEDSGEEPNNNNNNNSSSGSAAGAGNDAKTGNRQESQSPQAALISDTPANPRIGNSDVDTDDFDSSSSSNNGTSSESDSENSQSSDIESCSEDDSSDATNGTGGSQKQQQLNLAQDGGTANSGQIVSHQDLASGAQPTSSLLGTASRESDSDAETSDTGSSGSECSSSQSDSDDSDSTASTTSSRSSRSSRSSQSSQSSRGSTSSRGTSRSTSRGTSRSTSQSSRSTSSTESTDDSGSDGNSGEDDIDDDADNNDTMSVDHPQSSFKSSVPEIKTHDLCTARTPEASSDASLAAISREEAGGVGVVEKKSAVDAVGLVEKLTSEIGIYESKIGEHRHKRNTTVNPILRTRLDDMIGQLEIKLSQLRNQLSEHQERPDDSIA